MQRIHEIECSDRREKLQEGAGTRDLLREAQEEAKSEFVARR